MPIHICCNTSLHIYHEHTQHNLGRIFVQTRNKGESTGIFFFFYTKSEADIPLKTCDGRNNCGAFANFCFVISKTASVV